MTVRCTVQRSGCGNASISGQDEPGKRTRRSLAYSPCLGELPTGERGRVITRAEVGLDARHGGSLARPPGAALQLSFQRIQFGTGNADQFGCFGAHAAPSFRRVSPRCRSVRPGWADPQLTLAACQWPGQSKSRERHYGDKPRSMAEPWNGRGEIRVQSAFPVRSAVLYVQVMA